MDASREPDSQALTEWTLTEYSSSEGKAVVCLTAEEAAVIKRLLELRSGAAPETPDGEQSLNAERDAKGVMPFGTTSMHLQSIHGYREHLPGASVTTGAQHPDENTATESGVAPETQDAG